MQTYCLTPMLLIYDIVDFQQVHVFGMRQTRRLSMAIGSLAQRTFRLQTD